MKRLLVLLAATGLLGAALLVPATAAGEKPRAFPPKAHPYGMSHGEWMARWFQWTVEVPFSESPAVDETGEKCGLNQTGRVWFLAASFTPNPEITRACTIPADKAIYVFVIANECSNVEPPPFFGDNEADLRACATAGFEQFFPDDPVVVVDGATIENISRYRTLTPVFSFTLPEDNIFGVPGGTNVTKSLLDGIAIMLKPMRPGAHEVVITASSPGLPDLTVRYNLTIVGKHR